MKTIVSVWLCLLLMSMAFNVSALVCEIDYEFKVDTVSTVTAQVTEKCSEGDSILFFRFSKYCPYANSCGV